MLVSAVIAAAAGDESIRQSCWAVKWVCDTVPDVLFWYKKRVSRPTTGAGDFSPDASSCESTMIYVTLISALSVLSLFERIRMAHTTFHGMRVEWRES